MKTRSNVSQRQLFQLGAAVVLAAVAPSILLSGCADTVKHSVSSTPTPAPKVSDKGQKQASAGTGNASSSDTNGIDEQQNLAELSSAELAELKNLADANGLMAVLELSGALVAAAWLSPTVEKEVAEQLIKLYPKFSNLELATVRAIEKLKSQLAQLDAVERKLYLAQYVDYFVVTGKTDAIDSVKFKGMFQGIIDDLEKILAVVTKADPNAEGLTAAARTLREQYHAAGGQVSPAMAQDMRNIMERNGYLFREHPLNVMEKKFLDAQLAFKKEFKRVFTALGGYQLSIQEVAAKAEMQNAKVGHDVIKGRLFIGATGLVLVGLATKDLYDILSDNSGEVVAVKRKYKAKREAITGN